ncbi:MAG TPA: hypothetical protein VFQ61_38480, partial [Polyangiaceae bacterium]|nr:hypothetical protein [Polyangiaceae bacterium]
VHKGRLHIAFAKDLGPQRVQVMLQTLALDDPALTTGLPVKAARDTAGTVIGKMRPIGVPTGRNPEPSVACTDQGCFVAWDDEKAALTAFVDHERGPLWHRQFGNKGARPALGRNERGAAVAWFEGSRLKLAPLTRDGVGKASVVSRVSGLQPYPDVMPGKRPGEWYLAFRDYESAHLEVFALRAECP